MIAYSRVIRNRVEQIQPLEPLVLTFASWRLCVRCSTFVIGHRYWLMAIREAPLA